MGQATQRTRETRTIPVDLHNEAPYGQLLGAGQACVECVLALLLALGFPLAPKATWRGGGGRTRHSHDARVRLGGLPIWRVQCATCKAGCTVRPPCVHRCRQLRPAVARDALLATPGGLRLA